MAVKEVQQFDNTVAAGTPINNPAIFPMALLNLDIEWIEWKVPPGPRGTVGFWIGSHGQPIIPFSSGGPKWIVADGESAHWDTVDLPTSGDWEMRAYNLGILSHTITIRFGLAAPVPDLAAVPLFPSPTVLHS